MQERSCRVPCSLFRGRGTGAPGRSDPDRSWHQSSDEAPACVEETVATEERFCFVLVELYTCHSFADTTKSVKFTLCRLGCQVLTTYTEASSLQLVAYSVLHMRHQSFNPLTPD